MAYFDMFIELFISNLTTLSPWIITCEICFYPPNRKPLTLDPFYVFWCIYRISFQYKNLFLEIQRFFNEIESFSFHRKCNEIFFFRDFFLKICNILNILSRWYLWTSRFLKSLLNSVTQYTACTFAMWLPLGCALHACKPKKPSLLGFFQLLDYAVVEIFFWKFVISWTFLWKKLSQLEI